MLTARDARRESGRRRSLPSQKQRYEEYVFQRIEAFKESLPREQLLRLADEATEALLDGREDQFVLTEVLMADVVDTFIMKRLHIQKFPRWRAQFAKLRAAQRAPTHWGLDRTCPLVPLLGRVEPEDRALVIGSGAEACAYLLAAYDTHLDFWDREVGVVQRVEQKLNAEDLATRNFLCCVPMEIWMPSHRAPYDIVVLDVGALAQLDARLHPEVIARLQALTAEGGVHILLPCRTLLPEAVYSFYGSWVQEQMPAPRRAPKSRGTVLVKPPAAEMRQAEGA
ncbi:MAG: hypothetical protein ACJ8AU_04480 [Gemmatimonadales bacterium]